MPLHCRDALRDKIICTTIIIIKQQISKVNPGAVAKHQSAETITCLLSIHGTQHDSVVLKMLILFNK